MEAVSASARATHIIDTALIQVGLSEQETGPHLIDYVTRLQKVPHPLEVPVMRMLCDFVNPDCTFHRCPSGPSADGGAEPVTPASIRASLFAIVNEFAIRGVVRAAAELAAPGPDASRSEVRELALVFLTRLVERTMHIGATPTPALETAVNTGLPFSSVLSSTGDS